MAGETQWVAVDWGTSNVRAWGIAADGATTFSSGSDRGMGRITPADYPNVLDELIGANAAGALDVLICGMAGARQGWAEAPYVDTPARLDHLVERAIRPASAGRYGARILPGVAQRTIGREDVMRGEETQLLGLMARRPGFEGTVILPGTHSKWVEIGDGRIMRFATAMTGELYEAMSQHTVLRHSMAGETMGPATENGVAEGMGNGLDHPELLTSMAFRARAAALLSGKGPDWCSGYLSGLLVGAEIAGRRQWLGPEVPLIGSARLCRLYAAALKRVGIGSTVIDATEATLDGLKLARGQ